MKGPQCLQLIGIKIQTHYITQTFYPSHNSIIFLPALRDGPSVALVQQLFRLLVYLTRLPIPSLLTSPFAAFVEIILYVSHLLRPLFQALNFLFKRDLRLWWTQNFYFRFAIGAFFDASYAPKLWHFGCLLGIV